MNEKLLNSWFSTKSEYLAWRAEWKAQYAAISLEIKEKKKLRKSKEPMERSMAQGSCFFLRRKARTMLEIRERSKLEAQAQYLAAKAQSVPA